MTSLVHQMRCAEELILGRENATSKTSKAVTLSNLHNAIIGNSRSPMPKSLTGQELSANFGMAVNGVFLRVLSPLTSRELAIIGRRHMTRKALTVFSSGSLQPKQRTNREARYCHQVLRTRPTYGRQSRSSLQRTEESLYKHELD